MPVATSTIAAIALLGGIGGKTYLDNKKAAAQSKAVGDFKPPPPPTYQQPNMADAVRMQRARVTGASGRAATIKTGPNGIRNLPAPNAGVSKTLIGQ